jgi:hypothetical protein
VYLSTKISENTTNSVLIRAVDIIIGKTSFSSFCLYAENIPPAKIKTTISKAK